MPRPKPATKPLPREYSGRRGSPGAAPGSHGAGGLGPLDEEALGRVSRDLSRRTPPRNLEAEQAVLGGILLSGEAFHELAADLKVEDFYSPAHRHIFTAIQALRERSKPVELLTVADELERHDRLADAGGQAYLAELAESVVSAASAGHYAEIVREKAVQRRLIAAAAGIIEQSFEPGMDLPTLLDQSQTAVFGVAHDRQAKPYKSSAELVAEVFDNYTALFERGGHITGVPTGFARLDELTAGLQATDLIIIAGRPAMGKTAFVLNVAMNAAVHQEVPTAIFSLEMGATQLMQRMLCIYGLLDLKELRGARGMDDATWAGLMQAADALRRAPLVIDDTPAITSMDLRSRCRRIDQELRAKSRTPEHKDGTGLGLVVVDYLQLMRASRRTDSREQEISEISRNLKALAKELHVPVVALSQLNRKVEERTNKRPQLADLRESGAIEQDADIICFIYRDEVYNEDSPKKGMAEVIIGKHRNGPIGMVELAFIGKSTAFRDLSTLPEPMPSEVSHF